MDLKYFKPKSVTWNVSALQIGIGFFIAFTPMHGLVELAESLNAATGNVGAYPLIMLGAAGIGLRGAIK